MKNHYTDYNKEQFKKYRKNSLNNLIKTDKSEYYKKITKIQGIA